MMGTAESAVQTKLSSTNLNLDKTKKNMRICYETDNGPTDFWTSCFLYLFHHWEDTSYLLPICYLYSHCIALVKFVFNLSGQVHESLTHFSLLLTTSFPTAHNRKYRPTRTVASTPTQNVNRGKWNDNNFGCYIYSIQCVNFWMFPERNHLHRF